MGAAQACSVLVGGKTWEKTMSCCGNTHVAAEKSVQSIPVPLIEGLLAAFGELRPPKARGSGGEDAVSETEAGMAGGMVE